MKTSVGSLGVVHEFGHSRPAKVHAAGPDSNASPRASAIGRANEVAMCVAIGRPSALRFFQGSQCRTSSGGLIKVLGGAPGETKCQTDRTIDRGLGLGDKIGNLHLAANIQTAFQRRVGLAHCRVRYGAESKYNSDILYSFFDASLCHGFQPQSYAAGFVVSQFVQMLDPIARAGDRMAAMASQPDWGRVG